MGEYGDKAVVKIDADGSVLKCAKSLGADECGFTPGAKVCGKCGAMPVQMKEMMDEEEEEMPEEEMTEDISSEEEEMPAPAPKKKPVVAMAEGEEEAQLPTGRRGHRLRRARHVAVPQLRALLRGHG